MNNLKDFDKNIAKITKEQWQQLFDLIPIISKTKIFGIDPPPIKSKEGLATWQVVQPAEVVDKFFYTAYDIGIIHSFDWGHWEEGKKLVNNPKTDFNKLDIKTLCMLITAIVRNDRFCEGALVSAFENGIILKLLKALKVNVYAK